MPSARLSVLGLALVLACGCAHRGAPPVAAGGRRLETLGFFGLREDMTVVEVAPGDGAYTAVLARVLAARGHLVMVSDDLDGRPDAPDLAPPGSADLVVSSLDLHRWIQGKYAVKALAAAFRALKPGGILGIEDRRAQRGQDVASGGVPQGLAKHLAEHVGFALAATSEINAGPGESDRFTLKFVKPR